MDILPQLPLSRHTASLLAHVQQDLQILFSSISDSILLIEANGRIIVSNDISAQWLNTSVDELPGKNLFALVKPFGVPIKEWVYQAISKKEIFECDTNFGERFLHVRLIPVSEGSKIMRLIMIGQDVTEHRQAEEQMREVTERMERKVRERTMELETLNQRLLTEKMLSEIRVNLSQYFMQESQDYNRLLDHITTEISSLFGDICLIALFTSDLTQMEVRAITDRNSEHLQQLRELLLNRTISVETNVIASRILKGSRFSAKDIPRNEASLLLPAELETLIGEEGIKALEVFPLQAGDQPLGMLGIARKHEDPYSEEEISFISGLLSSIA